MTWDIIWQHPRLLHHLSINHWNPSWHGTSYDNIKGPYIISQLIRSQPRGPRTTNTTNSSDSQPMGPRKNKHRIAPAKKNCSKASFSCLSDNLQKALVATCPCSSIERSSSYPPLLPGTAAQWCSAKIQMCTPRTSWYRSPFLQHVAISAFRKLFCPKRSKNSPCHLMKCGKRKIQIMLSK